MQRFAFVRRGGYLESADIIPEPHAFAVQLRLGADEAAETFDLTFEEHDHAHGDGHAKDNNMRAAVVHVAADAVVSVLVIVGLFLARAFSGVG